MKHAFHARMSLAVVLNFLLLAFLAGASPVAAHGHKACTSKGEREATCTFECAEGDTLYVSAYTADQSWTTPDVSGVAACGGVMAECKAKGSCGPMSSPEPTKGADIGVCHGKTHEPWWAKDVHIVTCASKGVDGSMRILRMVTDKANLRVSLLQFQDGHLVDARSWIVPHE